MSIFELASSASAFWKNADNLRKREILDIPFPNLWLDGKTLGFTLRKPFNLFLKEANHIDWLPYQYATRTFTAETKYKLKPKLVVAKMTDEHFEDCLHSGAMVIKFHSAVAMAA